MNQPRLLVQWNFHFLPNTDEATHPERITSSSKIAKREGKTLGRKTNGAKRTKATGLEVRKHDYGIKLRL